MHGGVYTLLALLYTVFNMYANVPGFVPLVELSEDVEIKEIYHITVNVDYTNVLMTVVNSTSVTHKFSLSPNPQDQIVQYIVILL